MLPTNTDSPAAKKPKKSIAIVNEVEISFEDPIHTGREILKEAEIKHPECVDLYQLFPSGDFERISLDEKVDFSKSGVEKFITKEVEFRNYTVDGQQETTDQKKLTADRILKLAGIDPEHHFLILVKNDNTKVSYARKGDEEIKITCPPMQFLTGKKDTVCDFEQCCHSGTIPVISYRYVIKINSEKYTVDEKEMTGRQILALIGQTPESYYLRFKHKGGSTIVGADEVIDFTKCGVERFSAKAKNCTEGRVNQRDFSLPEEDADFLKKLNLSWDSFSEGSRWLILRDYALPIGYNVEKCDVAIAIPANYPIEQLDMFYMYPNLVRADRQVIGALSPQIIEGKQYQRWSRHRTPQNQWVPGEDNLATHLELMIHSLREEFTKR
ncbi:multiubiquitin domain-containing protein [Pedobacter vanadiisoli]|uniref:Multiubiquitin domain-containing protein n=1 Tax=Pedobacter vanadiisoli TaxID=1761975 RepID=A0ABW5MLL5_9SPHI